LSKIDNTHIYYLTELFSTCNYIVAAKVGRCQLNSK